MELIVANLYGKTRKATLNGRDHLVVPMTLIVEGVLAGSQGPLFYPGDELAKDPAVWNGMPVVLNHPTVNGTPVSARIPDVMQQSGLGTVYNSDYHHGRRALTSEGWFDVSNTQRVSPQVWESLKAGKPISLSTGVYTQNRKAPPGSKDRMGRSYEWIATNYKPDHIAILPDMAGACSIADGCGINLNSADLKANGNAYLTGLQRFLALLGMGNGPAPTVNQLSHGDVRQELYRQLRERFPGKENEFGYVDYDTYILETFDKYMVYEHEGKLYRLDYSTDNRSNTVSLSSESPTEVRRVTTYKPVDNGGVTVNDQPDDPGEDYMAVKLNDQQRKQIVDGLVANCSCPQTMPWKGKDANTLNALSDEVLMAYQDVQNAIKQNTPATTPGARKPEDSYTDGLGNRHVWNVATSQWDVYPAVPVPVAQPVGNGGPQPTTQNPGTTHLSQPAAQPNATPQVIPVPVKPQTDEEWYRNAPPNIQAAVRNAAEITLQEKANLIGQLIANHDQGTRDQAAQIYQNMELPQLRMLVQGMPKQTQNQPAPLPSLFNYAGAAGVPANQPITEEPLTSPVYNYGKQAG